MPGDSLNSLSPYHPVVIEGAGGRDTRDPGEVAGKIADRLVTHWAGRSISRPPLLITQGDPLEPRGISAITPRVAQRLNVLRGLVCLDEAIAPYHARDADRSGVVVEFRYSQFEAVLEAVRPGAVGALQVAVDEAIESKNNRRHAQGMPPLRDYFRDFAMLQEVTKAACRQLCGEITVAHTDAAVHEFSVTSFYTVGLALGWIEREEMMMGY
ncbi:hypothetical protein [Spiribacter curvatus]|uniref:hypothetical protein n=1 Tax=Spiribacter curvatus TaxID=1335757 RepID=UPI000405E823|nr:hypothetical protein [Spiribacter curvatus]